MATPKKKTDGGDTIVSICRNKKASFEFELHDRLECGLVLTGTEVKSLREGNAILDDSYARLDDGEIWLLGCEIPEYTMAHRFNHKPKRPRKLLLHKREIDKFVGKASQQGYTIVPTRMYFKNGRAKVEIAIARGKKLHDKRESQKKETAKKEISRAMKRSRR